MNKEKMSTFLVDLRKEKGLTQSEEAEIFVVSPQAVSKWENGDSIPDITLLERLASFYGVTLEEILNGERKEEIKEEPQTKKEPLFKNRNFLFDSIGGVGSLIGFLLVQLLKCFTGYITTYIGSGFFPTETKISVTFNFYNILFTSNYKYGNYIAMLGTILFWTAAIISIIIALGKSNNKALHILRLAFFYGVFACFIFVTLICIDSICIGMLILDAFALGIALMYQFVPEYRFSKKFNLKK